MGYSAELKRMNTQRIWRTKIVKSISCCLQIGTNPVYANWEFAQQMYFIDNHESFGGNHIDKTAAMDHSESRFVFAIL